MSETDAYLWSALSPEDRLRQYGVEAGPLPATQPSYGQRVREWLPTTWPVRAAQSLYAAATLPGDVATGRVSAEQTTPSQMSPETLQRVNDLAGIPVVSTSFSAPAGALGSGPVLRRSSAANMRPLRSADGHVDVWQGSPHRWDFPDRRAYGSGEGYMAEGAGLYGAERRNVAEWYRNNYTPITLRADSTWGKPVTAPQYVNDIVDHLTNTPYYNTLLAQQQRYLPNDPPEIHHQMVRNSLQTYAETQLNRMRGQRTPAALDALRREDRQSPNLVTRFIADDVQNIAPQGWGGYLYNLRYHAPRERMLQRETRMDQQPQYVQDAANQLAQRYGMYIRGYEPPIGARFQSMLEGRLIDRNVSNNILGVNHQTQASTVLRRAGIPGINYRGGGDTVGQQLPDHYVMFDPRRIEVLRREEYMPDFYRGGEVTQQQEMAA